MEKQLHRQDSGFVSSHQGCIWSLMHILDYHHWHNVKKMLPHRKHARGRRIRGSGSRKATLKNRDNSEREVLNAEAEPLLVKQHSTKTISAKKRTRKSHIKASRASSKEESNKSWILSFSVQSWLWRTSEIHEIEPSDNYLKAPYELVACNEDYTNEQAISPEQCGKVMESSPSKKQMMLNQLEKDELNDQLDMLELFKANKDFFLKFLQDSDVSRNQFPGLQKSKTNINLTKSRSFPVADSSQARYVRPSTLKHKQNEIWSFRKGDNVLASTRAPKLVASESKVDCVAGKNSVGSNEKQETSMSSPGLPDGFSHQGWNQLVMKRFKDIKQKLMHALQESRKENIPSSIKSLLSEEPSEYDGKEVAETPEMDMFEERSKIEGLEDNLSKHRLHRVSTTSSLDESLNRYTQLFENSCRSEAKLNHSRSLKLKSEENVPSSGNAQKSTRRNLSLPDLDSLCSFLNGPPRDAFRLAVHVKNIVDQKTSKEDDNHIDSKTVSLPLDTDMSERLEVIAETKSENSIVDKRDAKVVHEFVAEPAEGESRTHENQDVGFTTSPDGVHTQKNESSILESCSSDCTTSQEELSILEEFCSTSKCEKTESEQKSADIYYPQFVVDKTDDHELNYVRDVLELSGFLGHEYIGTWYSMDQPLDPSVFKELEVKYQYNLDFTEHLDHQLLFDLVNEILIDIHERSYTYFPRALSFSGSKHRPMPKGHHLLKDVWTQISSYMSFRPELDQSLEDVIARDLAKADCWMHVQWETECVALELEDLIIEDLLDEVICS